MNDNLEKTKQVLILTEVANINTTKAVESLAAALKTFSNEVDKSNSLFNDLGFPINNC